MNRLFTIDSFYRSHSNISVVFEDGREVNINPDHLERWLYKTDRLDCVDETWAVPVSKKMTMEDYWESAYVMKDLYTYIVVHSITDPLDIGKPLEKIVSEYVHKIKKAI